MDELTFSFSDTIAGYVIAADRERHAYRVRTSDDREFQVRIKANTYAQIVRNLGEPYIDCTAIIDEMLEPGRYVYTYGIFYPQGGAHVFEAQFLLFVGRKPGEYLFEKPDWWVRQIRGARRLLPEGPVRQARSTMPTTARPSS